MKLSYSLLLALISINSLAFAMDSEESQEIGFNPSSIKLQSALAKVGLKLVGSDKDKNKCRIKAERKCTRREPFIDTEIKIFTGVKELIDLKEKGCPLANQALNKLAQSENLLKKTEALQALRNEKYDPFERLVIQYKKDETGIQSRFMEKKTFTKKQAQIHTDIHIRMGEENFKTNKFQEAITYFKKAEENEKSSFYLGECFYRLKQPKKAVHYYTKVADKGNKDVVLLCRLVECHRALKNEAMAQKYLVELLEKGDEKASLPEEAYVPFGKIYWEKKNYAKALKYFEKAESLLKDKDAENFPELLYLMGRCYYLLNNIITY